MRSDHQEFASGLKLAAIAAISAVVTAAVVIGAGRAVLPQAGSVAAERPDLTAVVLR